MDFSSERYFKIHHLTDSEKVTVVVVSFEWDALKWYRWTENRKSFRDWDDLSDRLLHRFRPSSEGDAHEQFMGIIKDDIVADYCKRFEGMVGFLPNLTESMLRSTFTKGLSQNISVEIRDLKREILEEMMEK